MQIEVAGLSVKLHRKRVKNMNLRIQRSGHITISAPLKMPLQAVYQFLQDKRSWIEKHRLRLQQQQPPLALTTGTTLYYMGHDYALHVFETHTKPHVIQIDQQIHLYIKPQATEADKRSILHQWYREALQQHLPALLQRWQATIGVSCHHVQIRLMKTRWGSCHPVKKHISLNLRLIEKPLICLEYVIVHELIHLLEASHNARFYAFMDFYLPEWKQIKKILQPE